MEAARLQRQWQLEDRDEARTYSRQVLGHLVTDAEASGFNPLSILRNGGASNYNAAAGFAPLSRSAPVRQAPETVVASGDIGAGVSRVGDFLANFDPFADDKREQESRLIESQIASLNAGGLSGVKRGRGSYASADRSGVAKGASLSSPKSKGNAPGEGTLVGGDDPKVSSMGWNDRKYGWHHAPFMPDAETVENIYGDSELLSMGYGAAKLLTDAGYSAYRNVKAGIMSRIDKIRNTKPDPKYRREYFNNIRESVPSLAR